MNYQSLLNILTKNLAIITVVMLIATPFNYSLAVILPEGPGGGGNSNDDLYDLGPGPTTLDPDGDTGQNNGPDPNDDLYDLGPGPTTLDPDGDTGQTYNPGNTNTGNNSGYSANDSSTNYPGFVQDPNSEGPAGESINEPYDHAEAQQAALENQAQNNAEASKEDAESAQQKQEADKQKCMSEQGAGGANKLSNTLQQALSKTVKEVFTKQLPQAIVGGMQMALSNEIKGSLTGRIGSGNDGPQWVSSGGIDLKTEISNQLMSEAGQRFNVNFKNALQRQSNGGAQTLSSDQVKELARQEFQKSLLQSYPLALKKGLFVSLAGDDNSTTKRPGILRTLSENNLPGIASSTLQQHGTTSYNQVAPGLFAALAPDIFDTIFTLLQSKISSNKLGNAFGSATLNNAFIETIVNVLVTGIATNDVPGKLNKTSETLLSGFSKKSETDNTKTFLSENLDHIPFTTILQNVNGSLNGSMDSYLQINSGARTKIENQLTQVTNSGFGNNAINAHVGVIIDNLNSANLSNNNPDLNKGINSLFQDAARGGSINVINFISGSTGGNGGIGNDVNILMQQVLGSQNAQNGGGGVWVNTGSNSSNGGGGGGSSGIFGNNSFGAALTGQMSGPLSGVTNQMSNIIMSPVNDAFNGMTNDLASGLGDGLVGGFGKDLLGGISLTGIINDPIGTLSGAAIQAATNLVQGAITTLIGPAVAGVLAGTGAIASTAAAVSSLGIFVPTSEQIGLLTLSTVGVQTNTSAISATTKSTDKTIKDTNQLTIEICTKQKALERMKAEEEQARKVDLPNLQRDATARAEQYANTTMDFIKNKGYIKRQNGQDTQNPLFVVNTQDHLMGVKNEAKAIFMDALANSANIFKQETVTSLRQAEMQNMMQSTITKEESYALANGQLTNQADFWRVFQARLDPFTPNTPESSDRIARNLMAATAETAIEVAKTEILASNGFLPVRKCAEYTQDGATCARWINQTPAIEVADTASQILAYKLNKLLNPEPGSLSPNGGPSLDELRLFQPKISDGGAKGPNSSDLKGVLDVIANLISRIKDYRTNQASNEPSVAFDYSIPPVDAIETGEIADAVTLTWSGNKISSCKAANNWLGNSANSGTINITKASGVDIGTTGKLIIPLPFNFDLRFIRTRNGIDGSYPVITNTLAYAINTKTINAPSPETLSIGDQLSIRLFPYTQFNAATTTVTAANINNPLPDLQAALEAGYANTGNQLFYPEFSKFKPAYSSSSITFMPNLEYSISCVADTGATITKSVTINP